MTSTPTLPPELDPRGPSDDPSLDDRVRHRATSRPTRWLRGLAIATATVVLGVSGVLWAVYARVDGNIERLAGITSGGEDDATTFLIVGSDTRDGEGNEDYQGVDGQEQVSGARSDTTILATFHPDDTGATLVSFPRDSWVTIPAHTARDGTEVGAREERINTAFQDGGPKLLVDTVEELSGQEIDHYIEVDFAGFQNIVDAVGGVTVCLTEPAQDEYSGIDLPAGQSRLDGAEALAFVRQRNNLPAGDLDRIGRQQAFLSSIVREVSATGTLLNPLKMSALLNAVSRSIRVDDGLSVDGLKDLALRFREAEAGQVTFATAPVAQQKRIDGKAVLLLDDDKLHAMFGDSRPPAAEGPVEDIPVEDISVAVLNGAGVQGLARKAADDLAAIGFAIAGTPGNARTTGATTTIVIHPPEAAEQAQVVHSALPGSILEPDPSASDITVVVGSRYERDGATAPGAAAAQPGSSTESAGDPNEPAPAVETATAAEITCTA